jgi:hypothetical protein
MDHTLLQRLVEMDGHATSLPVFLRYRVRSYVVIDIEQSLNTLINLCDSRTILFEHRRPATPVRQHHSSLHCYPTCARSLRYLLEGTSFEKAITIRGTIERSA